jgi:hypothetical protein
MLKEMWLRNMFRCLKWNDNDNCAKDRDETSRFDWVWDTSKQDSKEEEDIDWLINW